MDEQDNLIGFKFPIGNNPNIEKEIIKNINDSLNMILNTHNKNIELGFQPTINFMEVCINMNKYLNEYMKFYYLNNYNN